MSFLPPDELAGYAARRARLREEWVARQPDPESAARHAAAGAWYANDTEACAHYDRLARERMQLRVARSQRDGRTFPRAGR